MVSKDKIYFSAFQFFFSLISHFSIPVSESWLRGWLFRSIDFSSFIKASRQDERHSLNLSKVSICMFGSQMQSPLKFTLKKCHSETRLAWKRVFTKDKDVCLPFSCFQVILLFLRKVKITNGKNYYICSSIILICQRTAEQSMHLETRPQDDILVVQTFLWKHRDKNVGKVNPWVL